MLKADYKVSRDDVLVGEVARANYIYRYNGKGNHLKAKPGQLVTSRCLHYRNMLFVPNENTLSSDLLYASPNYPILNISDDEECFNALARFSGSLIKETYCLAPLLEYFGYDEELTFKTILEIRNRFFNGKFALDNCELFGKKEDTLEKWNYRANGEEITDIDELQRRLKNERISRQLGRRTFLDIEETILPREFWDVLNSMGDKSLSDILNGRAKKMDAFTPHKQEGRIKKLKMFNSDHLYF